jgi:hypothetical protein
MDAEGTWTIAMQSPQGTRDATIRFADEGGALSGTLMGPRGEMALGAIGVDGDTLTWEVETPGGGMAYTATIAGDAISGTAQLGGAAGRTMEFSGTRSS